MIIKNRLRSAICVILLLSVIVPFGISVEAASGPTIVTTLTDNSVQRGSKKTFDVWAKNASGEKIKATVKLNGTKVEPTWDDNEKTSYTLSFGEEGENTIIVSAASDGGKRKELTYHITYVRANAGDVIGTAVWSVELFTIGCGYLIYPVEMPIYEGETSAEQLIRLLHENGFAGYYSGTVKASFYLAYIADGTAAGTRYNSYQKSGTPSIPEKLNLSPSVPSLLVPYLEETMTFYDPDDYTNNWSGYIGEFAFTNGSGWMYSVNNNFPNVGFADCYLSDGDVVRVQYTLGYGADIGGFGSVGTEIPNVDNQPKSGYYPVANKDALSKSICKALSSGLMSRENVKKAYMSALSVMEQLDASENAVDYAVSTLNRALLKPDAETDGTPENKTPAIGGADANSSNRGNSTAEESRTKQPIESGTSALSLPKDSAADSGELSKNNSDEAADIQDAATVGNENTEAIFETTTSEMGKSTQGEDNNLSDTEESLKENTNYGIWIASLIVIIAFASAFAVFSFYRSKRAATDRKGSHTDE